MEDQAKKIPYFSIIKKSLFIAWKNKYLWWFGFFIALSGIFSSFGYSPKENGSPASPQIMNFISSHIFWLAASVAAASLLIILLIIIGILGRSALIHSLNKNITGKESSFKEGIKEGKKYFWKIFLIALATDLFLLAIVIILATPLAFLFYIKSYWLAGFLTLIAIIIFIPLLFLISYLKIYGYIYVVLGRLSFWSALESAYNLLRKNVWPSIAMLLIFVLINIIFGIVIMMLLLPLAIIAFVIGLILFLILKSVGVAIITALAGLTAIIIFMGVKSFYAVWAQAIWISFFQEIARPKIEEGIAEKELETKTVISPDPANGI